MKAFTLITKIKKNTPLLVLGLILALVVVANFVPGTWLTGWDNLHPEFDFGLNIRRAWFSVWQDYQGLGLLSGMAHAADLFRSVFLWLVSPVFPGSLNRYFYHFLMLGLGSFGTYVFIRKLLLSGKNASESQWIALVGALFYLLNFGTVQYFFTPFEPFSTFWGFFPWELFVLFSYLLKPDRRRLMALALVNLAASAQAYVQVIFLVYLLVLGVFTISYLRAFRTREALVKIGVALGVILLVNAYWLLPNAYFVLTKVDVTREAVNNQINTERFYEWSRGHGNWHDFVLLRNLPFDTSATKDGLTDYMQPWRDYFRLPLVEIVSGAWFLAGALGLWVSNRFRKYFLPLFLFLSIVFLADLPVVELIHRLIRSLPLVGQVFRNPFTKMVVPLVFSLSLGVALFLEKAMDLIRKRGWYAREILYALVVLVVVMGLPVFGGQLFSSKVRVRIPDSYFKLFAYFQKADRSARIMNLPQDSFWGWGRYDWGSLGSGFLWYGIEQPIMDRAFDVWSRELEGYYWEAANALRQLDRKALNRVIDKYDIDYLVYDQSYSPSDQGSYRSLLKQGDLLTNNPLLEKTAEWGTVRVYRVKNSQPKVAYSRRLVQAKVSEFTHNDSVFARYGDYAVAKEPEVGYPYGTLFSSREGSRLFEVSEDNGSYLLTTSVPAGSYRLFLPGIANESLWTYELLWDAGRGVVTVKISKPAVFINGQELKQPDYQDEWPVAGGAPFTITDSNGLRFTVGRQDISGTVGRGYLKTSSEASFYMELPSGELRAFDLQPNRVLTATQEFRVSLDQPGRLVVRVPGALPTAGTGNLIEEQKPNTFGFYLQENQIQAGDWYQRDQNGYWQTYAKWMSTDTWWSFPSFPASGYLVKITSRQTVGFPLTLNVITEREQQRLLHVLLPKSKSWKDNYYLLPPGNTFDEGIQVRINNHSFNSQPSVSEIQNVSVTAFPYRFLSGIRWEITTGKSAPLTSLQFTKQHYGLYKASGQLGQGTLVLSQAFDSGWRAYLNGQRLREHVLVNNWANGWMIPEGSCRNQDCEIRIVFWPQYLQFFGFGLMVGVFEWLLLRYQRK